MDERERTKQAVRLAIAEQDQRHEADEAALRNRIREDARAVVTAIQLLRTDDEALEEKQRLQAANPEEKEQQKFTTALYDEEGRRRYNEKFTQYSSPIDDSSALWWPWGGSNQSSEQGRVEYKVLARAQWLRSRVKNAADPKAAALEAGAAFAEAAATAVGEQRRTVKEENARAASALEDDARKLLKLATQPSDPRIVLRRATNIAVIKETIRRRELLRPDKRSRAVRRARRLHARELAAERRRQRLRRANAHLAMLRDCIRAKGYAGFPTTRALEPNIPAQRRAAAMHARHYLALFCLEDDDATDSDDEEDYSHLCRYFCGKSAMLRQDKCAEMCPNTSTAINAGTFIDRDHAARASDIAMRRLSIPIVTTTTQSMASTDEFSSSVVIADLKPPPTSTELLEARNAALATVHLLFAARGVRHLDNDLRDVQWKPNSDAHLLAGSLGALADIHRQVLEEYVPRKIKNDCGLEDDADIASLLSELGALRAKAGNLDGARDMLAEATVERERRSPTKASLETPYAQAQHDGSNSLRGDDTRSRYGRLSRFLRAQMQPIEPHISTWQGFVSRGGLPTAPWRALPFPNHALKNEAESRIIVKSRMPAGIKDDDPYDRVFLQASVDVLPPPFGANYVQGHFKAW